MVAGRMHLPQSPLHPECAVNQRPVVDRLGGAPYPAQAVCCIDQAVLCQQDLIIPDETSIKRRKISDENGDSQHRRPRQRQKSGLMHIPFIPLFGGICRLDSLAGSGIIRPFRH